MAEVDIVKIEVTAPLPEEGAVDTTYRIEGTVKMFDAIGAPPFVYAEVQKKEWWKPEIVEETSYERGFPMPITGTFTIDWKPKKTGIYDVTVLATPAPISLPMVGVQPIVGKSDVMKITVSEKPEEPAGEFKELKITSYDSVTPPGVLEVNPGDTIRVTSEFDYIGPAVSGKVYTALWHPSWYDPHDEIADGERTLNIPDSPEPGSHITALVDVKVPTGFAGTDFGLYSKLMGVPGPGVTSPYYENIITIVGVPPEEADIADFEFLLTKGTYDIGEKVPFTAYYKYKGIAQAGQLTISLGTGVYPSFFTKHTYSPTPVEFKEAVDWEERGLEGSITLPDVLEAGQTYSVRAKLETLEVPTQEIDTDWAAFDITKGPPASDLANLQFTVERRTYNLGDRVNFSLPYEYKGKAQSGWLTISLGTGVAPSFWTKHTFPRVSVAFDEAMDWTPGDASGSFVLPSTLEPGQTYSVRAKLETADGAQETGTEYGAITITSMETLEVRIDPVGAGYVTTSPAPSGGTQHNWLFPYGTVVYVTAHPNAGYTFDWWSGEMTDTQDNPAPVYPMTEHRLITAHFKEVEPPEPAITDLVIVDPTQSTWIGTFIKFTAMFKYVGPAITGRVYIAIGNQNAWFNEVWDSGFVEFPINEAAVAGTQLTPRITVPIPDGSPGKYDVYAKIDAPGIADVFSPVYLNTITITL